MGHLLLLVLLAFGALVLTGCSLQTALTNPCTLTTLTVTKPEDTNDGACTTSNCSLRDAILTSNACKGTHTIDIPAGTYKLTLTGAGEDAAATGDLDISSGVVIQGHGNTIIDGNQTDRIFDIQPGQVVGLSGLTLQNGQITDFGSAIANQGDLTLDHVTIQKNRQTDPKGTGGAVFSYGATSSLEIHNSAVINNSAVAGATAGLYNLSGTMTIENVTFNGNQGYAVGNLGGQTVIRFSTLAGDNADFEIWNSYNGQAVTVSNSILAGLNRQGSCLQPVSSGGYNIDNSPKNTKNTCGLNGEQDMMDTDPKLGPLADNGGGSLSMALDPSSPAVESANLATCSPNDQRGVTRPQGSTCDRGAFELENPPARPTSTLVPAPTARAFPTSTPVPPKKPGNPTGTSFTFQYSGYCRQGPDKNFASVNTFAIGQSVVVEGSTVDRNWLLVRGATSTQTCWVSAALGTLSGQTNLPVIVQIPTLPGTPDNFVDQTKCDNGQRFVILSWNIDPYALGYNIYRKDKLINTVPARQTEYTDNPPYLTNDFTYSIESFNDYGVSQRAVTTALGCQ